ncbi:hypothetical protein [Methylobacterium symbioticum]|uniref:Uncharacterized protein n=1 Tax=Methylobacterium symbioticum TaxID=2584084 RepID=A0A509E9T1_9HYPH|nr:hypothetical protein [Methylobacterium symbioticum]VUD70259.1 hypothetical protein MET9862_00823 [Methylobacterium symbioticum]
MTESAIETLNRARASLVRERDTLARRIAGMDLAPVTMAEDLTRILVAIETLDRALTAEGQPYLPPMSAD